MTKQAAAGGPPAPAEPRAWFSWPDVVRPPIEHLAADEAWCAPGLSPAVGRECRRAGHIVGDAGADPSIGTGSEPACPQDREGVVR